MPGLKSIFSAALVIALAAVPFTSAAPQPTATRPFTVRAYQSPSPVGQGLSGYYLAVEKGAIYLTKTAPYPKPTLDVDHFGQASLVSLLTSFSSFSSLSSSFYLSARAQAPKDPKRTD